MKKLLKIAFLLSFSLNFQLFTLKIDEIKEKIKNYSFFIDGSKVKKLKSRIETFLSNESDILLNILEKIEPNDEATITVNQIIDYIDKHQDEMLLVGEKIESQATKTQKIEDNFVSFFSSLLSLIWNLFHPTSFLGYFLLALFLGFSIISLGLLISFLI